MKVGVSYIFLCALLVSLLVANIPLWANINIIQREHQQKESKYKLNCEKIIWSRTEEQGIMNLMKNVLR